MKAHCFKVSTILLLFILFNTFTVKSQCPIPYLYQTRGAGGGTSEVVEINMFASTINVIATLPFQSSSNGSAYSDITELVYISNTATTINVYDPSNSFSFVGTINLSTSISLNNLAVSGNNLVNVNGSDVLTIDLTSITTYPAFLSVTSTPITGLGSIPNDFVALGGFLYGMFGSQLIIIDINTGLLTTRNLTLNHSIDGVTNGAVWGSVWNDVFGNFYAFNNINTDIYRIVDVANPSSTIATKVFLASPSSSNDGFNCIDYTPLGNQLIDFNIFCNQREVKITGHLNNSQDETSIYLLKSLNGYDFEIVNEVYYENNSLGYFSFEENYENSSDNVFYKIAYSDVNGEIHEINETFTVCSSDDLKIIVLENDLFIKNPQKFTEYCLISYDGRILTCDSSNGKEDVRMDISKYSQGVYLIQEKYNGKVKTYRIFID
jgi:hypothetical protein